MLTPIARLDVEVRIINCGSFPEKLRPPVAGDVGGSPHSLDASEFASEFVSELASELASELGRVWISGQQ